MQHWWSLINNTFGRRGKNLENTEREAESESTDSESDEASLNNPSIKDCASSYAELADKTGSEHVFASNLFSQQTGSING